MNFTLTCPSKTFLLGEYYITQQGEALLINTSPKFSLSVCTSKNFMLAGIHDSSPAGKFIRMNLKYFEKLQLVFNDPYHGLGGLGASSAQFLLAWLALKKLQTNKIKKIDFNHLLKCYLQLNWNGTGIAPSGADLLSQISGNLCYINRKTLEIQTFDWPFPEVEFHLIHTHNKLATHEHLPTITNLNSLQLKNIFIQAQKALFNKNLDGFLHGINLYHNGLMQLNLVSKNTLNLLKFFNSNYQILAAKGCGALGSDIIVLITKKNSINDLKSLCKLKNLTYIANHSDLTTGVEIEDSLESECSS